MDLGLSPTHKLLSQSSKFESAEAFCKKVPKLIVGAYMNKLNVRGTDVFAEPMIFYRVVFWTRRHSAWFQVSQGQCSNIVLVHFYVHIRSFFHNEINFEDQAYFFSDVD